jgi:hypothetical protein
MTREAIRRRVFDDKDGWAVEERLVTDADESAAGEHTTHSYYYREQLAVRHQLDSKRAKRVAGFTLIHKDLRTIKAWVDVLREALLQMGASEKETQNSLMPTDPILAPKILVARAVFVAIVTTYGKLFVTAQGRSTTLDAKGWIGAQHKTWHDYLMHMRHSFTAHAGEGAESCRTVLAIDYSQSHRTNPRVFTELFQPTFVGLPELQGIELLLADLQAQAKSALDKATDALYDEVHAAFPPEKLKFLRMGAGGTRLVR